MITGIGTDIVEISRIRQSCEAYGDRFIHRVFTSGEITYAYSKKDPYPSLAVRFAVKEALIKAARVGKFHPHGWLDAEVITDARGVPSIELYGELKKELAGQQIHITVSHADHYATATVIIEKK